MSASHNIFEDYKRSEDVFADPGARSNGTASKLLATPQEKLRYPFDVTELAIPKSNTEYEIEVTRNGEGTDDEPYVFVADINISSNWDGSGESVESDECDSEDDAVEQTIDKLEDEKACIENDLEEKKNELIAIIEELSEIEAAIEAAKNNKIDRDWE